MSRESNPIGIALAEELLRLKEEYDSFVGIERFANDTLDEKIDRRKLKRICESNFSSESAGKIPLTIRELHVLDKLLRITGRGLMDVIAPPTVVDAMATAPYVEFVLGSKPRERRIDFSRWDIRSMQVALRAFERRGRRPAFGIEDVIFRDSTLLNKIDRADREKWYHDLEASDPNTIVCIGSPKANHGSEMMLARMFDVKPFRRWPRKRGRSHRPFFFAYQTGDQQSESVNSAFFCDPADIGYYTTNPAITKQLSTSADDPNQPAFSCFFDGEKLLETARVGSNWKSYAVIAAKKMSMQSNATWLGVFGLTGPATFGAAQAIESFEINREQFDPGDTVYQFVEVAVDDEVGENTWRKDERRVRSWAFMGDQKHWNQESFT